MVKSKRDDIRLDFSDGPQKISTVSEAGAENLSIIRDFNEPAAFREVRLALFKFGNISIASNDYENIA